MVSVLGTSGSGAFPQHKARLRGVKHIEVGTSSTQQYKEPFPTPRHDSDIERGNIAADCPEILTDVNKMQLVLWVLHHSVLCWDEHASPLEQMRAEMGPGQSFDDLRVGVSKSGSASPRESEWDFCCSFPSVGFSRVPQEQELLPTVTLGQGYENAGKLWPAPEEIEMK